jgi:hypothetical protein
VAFHARAAARRDVALQRTALAALRAALAAGRRLRRGLARRVAFVSAREHGAAAAALGALARAARVGRRVWALRTRAAAAALAAAFDAWAATPRARAEATHPPPPSPSY